MNKCISTIVIAALSGPYVQAQTLLPAPKLVVNITIDQLRTDYLEQFAPLYSAGGFKKLLSDGRIYEAAKYSFSPVDRSSATACIASGTTPYYNNIPSNSWLNRETLRPIYSVDDNVCKSSPAKLLVSTIGDEIKIASNGNAQVYAIAQNRDAAILSAGHAANGAFWIDEKRSLWSTSDYYPNALKWINAYGILYPPSTTLTINNAIAEIALKCISSNALGRDDITDYIAITFSAAKPKQTVAGHEIEKEYVDLDHQVAAIISKTEQNIGHNNVLFVLTSTGYSDDDEDVPDKYKIPSGSFYINRTGALLNMYLNAIYGQGKYVEAYFHNHIYLNRKFIEDKRLPLSEIITRSEDFLKQISGISGVKESPYKPAVSGDLIIDVTPGWKLINEETGENYISRASFVPFPIIFYGYNIKAERIATPVVMERIAPTITKSIHIRAPNACSSEPLF
jgi:hypothetical protein